jgi:hypothetical protein
VALLANLSVGIVAASAVFLAGLALENKSLNAGIAGGGVSAGGAGGLA